VNCLYRKNQLWFALLWIALYVVGTSVADMLSKTIGAEKSVTLAYLAVLTAVCLLWLGKNGLLRTYGLCKPRLRAKQLLLYMPLVVMASCNLWFGVRWNYGLMETVLYILSMLLVGFLEELIFRGFLFNAMRADSLKAAVIVSSLTFGIGHIVNLFNGSGADLLPNLLQVCYAAAGGFLFVVLFIKTGSLLPCVLTHSVLNALSVFAVSLGMWQDILVSVALCAVSIGYALFLLKQKDNKIGTA
jgi:membrane protease YdiL (CAAX protease family)